MSRTAVELQRRIDDAVAKLKAADELIVDWQPSLEEWAKCVSLIVHARAALVGDQGKHLGENQAESGGSKALTSGNSWANRDLDLSGEALRAVEEADDAAEPACECFVVPEEQWTRHYDATEPGSMVEQNPDCPVHPAQQADAAGDLP